MKLESRLGRVFREAEGYEPSPDLFSRVTRSIEEDRLHRRRRGLVILWAVGLVLGCALLVLVAGDRGPSGSLRMTRWAMEVIETAIMASLVVALGPAIRRFGSSFIRELFRFDADASARFLDLLDMAYYLTFTGLTMMGVRLAGLGSSVPVGLLLDEARLRLALLLLAMGLLHSMTIAAIPVVSLIGGATRWRHRHRLAGTPGTDPEARMADRLVRVLFGTLAALVFLAMLAVAVSTVLVGIG